MAPQHVLDTFGHVCELFHKLSWIRLGASPGLLGEPNMIFLLIKIMSNSKSKFEWFLESIDVGF